MPKRNGPYQIDNLELLERDCSRDIPILLASLIRLKPC